MKEYHIFHDCGKPFCIEIDENNKPHFPNHTQKSFEIWSLINGSDKVGKLISMDMDIHLLKDKGVNDFSKYPEAISLIITGLAEIHSNSEMFGGLDSKSFKIKYKQIDRRSKSIIKKIKNN
jgi:hypothetical protein